MARRFAVMIIKKNEIMDYKEIQNLIKLINNSNLAEFKMKDGDFRLTIRTKEYQKLINVPPQATAPPVVVSPPVTVPAETPAQSKASAPPATHAEPPKNEEQETKKELLEIRSPIVGTFYRAAGPDKEPYVKIGDNIDVGTVFCIVEAMKLFNEIESEVKGKIVDVLVEDATPVEYDQVLFLVDPKG